MFLWYALQFPRVWKRDNVRQNKYVIQSDFPDLQSPDPISDQIIRSVDGHQGGYWNILIEKEFFKTVCQARLNSYISFPNMNTSASGVSPE